MKNLKISIALSIIVCITLSSCGKDKKVIGSGILTSETRDHIDFNAVDIAGVFETVIEYSEEFHVEITGEDNVMKHVHTNVRNNTLEITMDDRNYQDIEKMTMHITCPDINEVTKQGVNKTTIRNFENLDKLELNQHGVDDFILEGTATKLVLEKSGVSDLLAFDFEVEEFVIEQNGVGETEITCITKMSGELNGVGNIYYKGNPEIDVEVNGVGRVKDAN